MSFGLWHLSFIRHLPPCVTPPVCTAHKQKRQMLTKRILRTLTTESAENNRLTYENELLDFRKNSNFYKTNHSSFPTSVHQPPWLVKTIGKPTKRIVCTLRVKWAGGNRLTYEKERFNSRKNSRSSKTNHPGFPHAPPPTTRGEASVSRDTDSSQKPIVGSQGSAVRSQ